MGFSVSSHLFKKDNLKEKTKSLKIFRIGGEMGNLLFTKRSKMGSLAQMKTNRKDRSSQLQNFLSLNKFLINTQRKAGWNYFKIFL
mgnify:CR=1 FL=1